MLLFQLPKKKNFKKNLQTHPKRRRWKRKKLGQKKLGQES
jgi:hypothetical protein